MNIFEAINACMSDIGAVGKTSKNTTQGFMFRGIDAVMNAINPALVKNKVFVVPEIIEQTREERQNSKGTILIYSICKVRYTFYAEDGSHIEAVVIGEGMDTGDKATNKAMSIAFKYACFQVFCIPTEEMKDPDEESHEVAPIIKNSAVASQETQNEAKNERLAIISAEHLSELKKLLADNGIDEKAVCTLYNLNSIDACPNYKADNILENIGNIKERLNGK